MKHKLGAIRTIVNLIDDMARKGTLEPDEHQTIKKATAALEHAVSIRDYVLIEKAIVKIAKALVVRGTRQP